MFNPSCMFSLNQFSVQHEEYVTFTISLWMLWRIIDGSRTFKYTINSKTEYLNQLFKIIIFEHYLCILTCWIAFKHFWKHQRISSWRIAAQCLIPIPCCGDYEFCKYVLNRSLNDFRTQHYVYIMFIDSLCILLSSVLLRVSARWEQNLQGEQATHHCTPHIATRLQCRYARQSVSDSRETSLSDRLWHGNMLRRQVQSELNPESLWMRNIQST